MTKYITHIQLKAARHVLNLGVRDVAKILKVSKATISKTELGKTRSFLHKHSAPLIDFFASNSIKFPSEYGIRYESFDDKKKLLYENTFTRFQLKAARHILNISQRELAESIGIDKKIISRAELLSNAEVAKIHDQSIILKLKTLFQEHNIDFPDPLSIFFKRYVDKIINK